MPTAVVTGATGFLGGHLVRLLCDRGYRARALYRSESTLASLQGLPVEACRGDVTAGASLDAAMHGKPDLLWLREQRLVDAR